MPTTRDGQTSCFMLISGSFTESAAITGTAMGRPPSAAGACQATGTNAVRGIQPVKIPKAVSIASHSEMPHRRDLQEV